MSEDLTTQECVYLGRRIMQGKLYMAYILYSELIKLELVEHFELGVNESWFLSDKKSLKNAIPGAIYSMECIVQDKKLVKARTGSKQYKSMLTNKLWVARLETMDKAAYATLRADAMLAKLKATSALERECAGIKRIYSSLPYRDRMAFELLLLNYIRRG